VQKITTAGSLRDLAEKNIINYKGTIDRDMLDGWVSEYGFRREKY